MFISDSLGCRSFGGLALLFWLILPVGRTLTGVFVLLETIATDLARETREVDLILLLCRTDRRLLRSLSQVFWRLTMKSPLGLKFCLRDKNVCKNLRVRLRVVFSSCFVIFCRGVSVLTLFGLFSIFSSKKLVFKAFWTGRLPAFCKILAFSCNLTLLFSLSVFLFAKVCNNFPNLLGLVDSDRGLRLVGLILGILWALADPGKSLIFLFLLSPAFACVPFLELLFLDTRRRILLFWARLRARASRAVLVFVTM